MWHHAQRVVCEIPQSSLGCLVIQYPLVVEQFANWTVLSYIQFSRQQHRSNGGDVNTPERKNTLEIRNMDKYDQPKCLCIGYISSHHHLYRCKITIKSQTIPLYLHKHPIKSEWIIWLTWKSLLIIRPFTDNSRNASHHSSDVRFIQIIPLIDAKSQWRSHHTP